MQRNKKNVASLSCTRLRYIGVGFAKELFRPRQTYSIGENIIKRSANGHTTVKYITLDKIIIVKVSEELPAIFSAPLLE
jgi:hypothetical protein